MDTTLRFRFNVRLAERERTGVLTRRPLAAEQVRLLRRTPIRARGVTWKHARLASERPGSESPRVHSGDAFRPRFLAEQAEGCTSPPAGGPVCLVSPQEPAGIFRHRGLGPGHSPYEAEAPVQLRAVPFAAMV